MNQEDTQKESRILKLHKVVYTAGTWDLFHIGHLNRIRDAFRLGATLIVGVSTDELVEKYKGKRPFISFEERFSIISALKYPDMVVTQIEQFDTSLMLSLGVDIVVMGNDWENAENKKLDILKEMFEVIFSPRTEGISSSLIKHRLKKI